MSKRGAAWFVLLKYIEVTITAITTFLLAKKIGPEQMGIAIPALLYLTYSNYFSLGVNQIVIKTYSRLNDKARFDLLTFNLQYIFGASIIGLSAAFLLLDKQFFIPVSLISILALLRSYFSAYYRVVDRIRILNLNNLIFALLLLIGTWFCVEKFLDYLYCWGLASFVSMVLYFKFDTKVHTAVLSRLGVFPSLSQMKFNLSQGLNLALLNIITTILLTTDRIIIDKLGISNTLKGTYQLADHAGTAYYLFFSTILFYFYPSLIHKLSHDLKYREDYIRYLKLIPLALPFLFILIFGAGSMVSIFLFPEYPRLEYAILLSVILKTCVLLMGMIGTYYIAIDREIKYVKSMAGLLIGYLIFAIANMFFNNGFYLIVPLGLSCFILIDYWIKIYKSDELQRNNP